METAGNGHSTASELLKWNTNRL